MEKGCKVVCVDDSPSPHGERIIGLKRGQEYIIQDIIECPRCGAIDIKCGPVLLSTNNSPFWFCECGHCMEGDLQICEYVEQSRFRKVEEKKEVKVEYVKKEVEIEIEVEQPILN